MTQHGVSTSLKTGPQSRFVSPDRYAVARSAMCDSPLTLRTSLHPSELKDEERVHRRKFGNTSAFRSLNESRVLHCSTQSATRKSRPCQPPHYTPSFVYTRNREQLVTETRQNGINLQQSSAGGIWGTAEWQFPFGPIPEVDLGNGAMESNGSNASMINSNFIDLDSAETKTKNHQERLGVAMDVDTARRVLPTNAQQTSGHHFEPLGTSQYHWFNGGWAKDYSFLDTRTSKSVLPRTEKVVPSIAFRVLDAPRLKDDYYCSILSYCRKLRTLAVALNHRVYLWTESSGVRYPPLAAARPNNYVTSLAFSSDEGQKAILAITRHNGDMTLWSLLENRARFEVPHPSATSVVAFKPRVTERKSNRTGLVVSCEDLLVGDDRGHVYYYSVEWPAHDSGSLTLLAKITAHSQNVCGLAWAPHGKDFVTGGNDNCALLFNCEDVLKLQARTYSLSRPRDEMLQEKLNTQTGKYEPTHTDGSLTRQVSNMTSDSDAAHTMTHSNTIFGLPGPEFVVQTEEHNRGRAAARHEPASDRTPLTPPLSPNAGSTATGKEPPEPVFPRVMHAYRYRFDHSAAVKAIAFATWQPTLLATGGGSNDKQIHFHHTGTGTTLAIINVFAQVTSLVWSLTRREIAATFGYAQPDHETRIAVFLWPSCECVVSIPWERKANGDIGRALWAIPYPGGPNDATPERLQEQSGTDHAWDIRQTRNVQVEDEQHNPTGRIPITPEASPNRREEAWSRTRTRALIRGEGERWASRTEEEGSLIVACCDQTVKFFEVWAGKSKGKSRALGSKAGIFGGSKVLEGWCEDAGIDEVGTGEHVIQ